MEKVDLVLVGAEGVVESGGIINKVRCFISCVYFFSQVILMVFQLLNFFLSW